MSKLPNDKLTVVFVDSSPMYTIDSSPRYRAVTIVLTDEQREQLKLKPRSCDTQHNDEISQCFIEPLEDE